MYTCLLRQHDIPMASNLPNYTHAPYAPEVNEWQYNKLQEPNAPDGVMTVDLVDHELVHSLPL